MQDRDRDLLRETPSLSKSSTGIWGLDDVLGGGLPAGRTSLVCGGPGCGKTLLATEFLVRGAIEHGEPGVFISFEESASELVQNAASLGFDLQDLIDRDLLAIDYVHIERSEIEETGDYDLEGLFLRLGLAVDRVGARRVVMDTLEALFAGLPNQMILRAELRRLFRWLKDRDLTTIVTAERGDGSLTRHGLEEYVSDCVISLDHRVTNQISTRRIRVVKYRGSSHGTNEYPFMIGDDGLSVLPITSNQLDHEASVERVSTGIADLDEMLEGKGYFRGSSVLISGTAGTGKTTLGARFAEATCARNEQCAYLSFEESPQQLIRNMLSVGIDLKRWVDAGLLHIQARRPTQQGMEMHLVAIHRLVEMWEPSAIVIDPITSLLSIGDRYEVEALLARLIDYLKTRQITTLLNSLTRGRDEEESTDVGISSLMDTWILLQAVDQGAERNRVLSVLKSRGMAHSNQVRYLQIMDRGVVLNDVSTDVDGVLEDTRR